MSTKEMGYQKGGEQSRKILVFLVLFMLFFFFSLIFVSYLLFSYRDQVIREGMDRSQSNRELERLRSYEEEQLSTYGVLDAERGIFRIPITEAIKKVEERYQRLNNR